MNGDLKIVREQLAVVSNTLAFVEALGGCHGDHTQEAANFTHSAKAGLVAALARLDRISKTLPAPEAVDAVLERARRALFGDEGADA